MSASPRRRSAVGLVSVAALALGFSVPAAEAAPKVVATVLPIQSLTAAVMEGVGEPTLLVKHASPHTYSLRPSDATALQEADLVFWVGDGFETFMEGPLASLSAGARVVALSGAPGVELLPTRLGDDWEAHEHGEHGEAGHGGHEHEEHAEAGHDEHAHAGEGGHDEHAEGGHDMHVWLAPDNARAMAAAIAGALGAADPANAERYRANAAALATRIDALDAELRTRLAPVRDEPFVVAHDAYQYFERAYGLNAVGSITVAPDVQPGARRLTAIRAKVEDLGARCVFAEPPVAESLADTIIEGTDARVGLLDPEGVGLDPGPDAYPTLMRDLAGSLVGCLSARS